MLTDQKGKPCQTAYTSIQPYMDYFVPVGCTASKPQSDVVAENMKCEYQQLNKVNELLEKEKVEEKEYLSWSAHSASLQTTALSPTATKSLLTLFEENAHSKAMIQQFMKLVKDAIPYINPGQTPIIGMNQAIYALAKQNRWERADAKQRDSGHVGLSSQSYGS